MTERFLVNGRPLSEAPLITTYSKFCLKTENYRAKVHVIAQINRQLWMVFTTWQKRNYVFSVLFAGPKDRDQQTRRLSHLITHEYPHPEVIMAIEQVLQFARNQQSGQPLP